MPRKPRVLGEYLHIVVRGVGQQILFEDDSDKYYYLSLLTRNRKELEIIILAYCLMDNHVHLLMYDPQRNISLFMQKTGISYAEYYNKKYDRTGHLFQDRYKSLLITDERYLLSAYRYILNNPQKAGIASAQEYFWSSYREYGKSNCLTDTSIFSSLIGTINNFESFMKVTDEFLHLEESSPQKNDAWAIEIIHNILDGKSGTSLKQMPKDLRDAIIVKLKTKGVSIRQLERLTGLNRNTIQRAGQYKK